MDITLKLDGEALHAATVQAIAGTLTPEMRSQLLEAAIKNVLTPVSKFGHKETSQLEYAFARAVDSIAQEEARKLVAEDETLRTRMRELLRTTADKILNTDVDALTTRMADALVASMRSRD